MKEEGFTRIVFADESEASLFSSIDVLTAAAFVAGPCVFGTAASSFVVVVCGSGVGGDRD